MTRDERIAKIHGSRWIRHPRFCAESSRCFDHPRARMIEYEVYEVVRLLATISVKVLIIDEIQHVLGPLLRQRAFLNVIKHLGNELQLPIVAVGTHDAFNAIQTDPQLANRFEPAVLQRWTMGEDYLRLLASFQKLLPLEHCPALLDPAMAIKVLSLSEGTIGEISALLCRAAIAAIENGAERITIASLERCGYVAPSERRRAAITAY